METFCKQSHLWLSWIGYVCVEREEFLVKVYLNKQKNFWFWIINFWIVPKIKLVHTYTYTYDRIGTIEISVIYQLCSEQQHIVGVHLNLLKLNIFYYDIHYFT